MRISLAVQQMPATMIPSAPFSLASASISGSWLAATTISERVGSWPWTRTLTWSSFITPMLAWLRIGVGDPKRMSERSVAIMAPTQPSERAVRNAVSRMFR